MESKRFTLAAEDVKKIGIGALMAILGALATYLLEVIPSVDFGSFTPIVVAVNSIIVNAIRKFISVTVYR